MLTTLSIYLSIYKSMTFIVLNITSHRISWWSGGVVVVHDHVCLPPDQRLADPCSLKSWGGRLLTISHVLTGCSFDLFGQAYDVRLRWIPDILWILQPLFYKGDRLSSTPMAECITGHTFRLHVSSPAQLFAFCAHVRSLRNALFFSVSHICSPFSLTCFSQNVKSGMWSVTCCQTHFSLVYVAESFKCGFPLEECLASCSGKPCPYASRKNISTCLKNFRKTTWPLSPSWRPPLCFSMIFEKK